MPLIHSASGKALHENIKKEVEAGKPPAQAEAIAYQTQRDAKAHHAPVHKGDHHHDKPMGH